MFDVQIASAGKDVHEPGRFRDDPIGQLGGLGAVMVHGDWCKPSMSRDDEMFQ